MSSSGIFSSRSTWDLAPNRFSQLLQRKRAAGAALCDLTTSNPTTAGLAYADVALQYLLAAEAAVYEPSARGDLRARQAVVAYYRDRGVDVSPDRIFLTASTSEGYGLLFKLLADAGASILAPQPSYPLFDFLAQLEGISLTPYSLEYEIGWTFQLEPLAAAITAQTRALMLVSPNNPTGNVVATTELSAIDRLAADHQLAVICDEVFSDFPLRDLDEVPVAAVRAEHALTFSLSGLSKVCGLPQFKLAWIVVGGPQQLVAEAAARLELIADTYLSVATPVQRGLPALLADRHRFQAACCDRLRTNRRAIATRLRDAPDVQLLAADAGWYACLRVPRVQPEEELVLQLLAEDDVVVHPGYFFDFADESYLVVSLLTPEEALTSGLERILRRVT